MKIGSLLISLSILLFSGCTKEDDEPTLANENIGLVYPVNVQDLNPCCINFQWNNPEAGNSRILISKSADFTELILDSSLVSNSLILDQIFQPDTEYFWKVSNGNSESASSFKIKDVISGLKPTYNNIKIRRYTWNSINGISNDTTYFST